MKSIRTRLARITAASALVLALGSAVATGPAVAGESEASSAPIATAPGAPGPDGTEPLSAPCETSCWVLVRTYISEPACVGGGLGLLASSTRYDDFSCASRGPAQWLYWDLYMHRR